MDCPYLEALKIGSMCNASFTLMVPSIYEMERFCTKEEHYRCPILLALTLRNRQKERRMPWLEDSEDSVEYPVTDKQPK